MFHNLPHPYSSERGYSPLLSQSLYPSQINSRRMHRSIALVSNILQVILRPTVQVLILSATRRRWQVHFWLLIWGHWIETKWNKLSKYNFAIELLCSNNLKASTKTYQHSPCINSVYKLWKRLKAYILLQKKVVFNKKLMVCTSILNFLVHTYSYIYLYRYICMCMLLCRWILISKVKWR